MLYVPIDRSSSETIHRQIYEFLKKEILEEKIVADEKFPSSRELANELKIARNTVIESYDQLIAEGYAYTKKGAGTFVSQGSSFQRPQIKERHLSSTKASDVLNHTTYFSFRTGIPDLSDIPIKKWAQIYHKIALDIDPQKLNYQNPMGCIELREQIADYLNRTRGAVVNPDCVLITSGAAQSFELLCDLVGQDECALVENPMSKGVYHTLDSNHINMVPVELDQEGMCTKEIRKRYLSDLDNLHDHQGALPKLIITTPSHQFPTGAVLPIYRRIDLVDIAQKLDAYVVEDDYDSEFRFEGSPLQAMQYLDPERVIYVGTFSKTLMPAIRIGYMVLPHTLISQMKEAKYIRDIHSPIMEQLTLAEFIRTGAYELHLRKMKKLYKRKRDLLVHCLREYFGENVTITGAHTGLHLYATFEKIRFDKNCMEHLRKAGIEVTCADELRSPQLITNRILDKKCVLENVQNSLIFGYGNTDPEQMRVGIQHLHTVLELLYQHTNCE